MSIRGRWWALSSFVQWRFIFKKLRTSTKLLLLCSMFGISIVVTTAALVAEKQIAIAFAHKELVGSRYLAIVRDIYPAILSLQTDPSFQSKPELLRALAAAENDASGRLQTAALQKTLAASLRELWDGKSTASENERVVLEALSNTRRLASRIGDDSNLALDSNLDSYHVQNIVVERLPALVSQLGEMQTFLRAASSTEAVSSAQAARLALLDTSIRIRSTIDGVKSDLEAAYRGNADGSVRRNIDAAIMTMIARVESYLSTIEFGLSRCRRQSRSRFSRRCIFQCGGECDQSLGYCAGRTRTAGPRENSRTGMEAEYEPRAHSATCGPQHSSRRDDTPTYRVVAWSSRRNRSEGARFKGLKC